VRHIEFSINEKHIGFDARGMRLIGIEERMLAIVVVVGVYANVPGICRAE